MAHGPDLLPGVPLALVVAVVLLVALVVPGRPVLQLLRRWFSGRRGRRRRVGHGRLRGGLWRSLVLLALPLSVIIVGASRTGRSGRGRRRGFGARRSGRPSRGALGRSESGGPARPGWRGARGPGGEASLRR